MPDKELYLNSGPSNPNLKKSKFDKSFTNHLTARPGLLYPVLVEEAPAGSSYKISMDMAFDMMPMVFPLQSSIKCHVSIYKVAFRNLMKSFKDFAVGIGDHVMPYIARQGEWAGPGSLADYMGIPTRQLASISRVTSFNFDRRGFFGQFTYVNPLTEGQTYEDVNLTASNATPLDSVIVPSRYDSGYIAAMTETIHLPMASNQLTLNIDSTTQPNISNLGAIYVYALIDVGQLDISPYGTRSAEGQFVVPYAFNGGGTGTRSFVSAGSSAISDGKFKAGTAISTTTAGMEGTLYSTPLTFQFYQRDVDFINHYIEQSGSSVRLLFVYQASASSVLGSAADFYDVGLADRLNGAVRDKEGQETGFDFISFRLATSTLTKGITYLATYNGFEATNLPFSVGSNGEPPALPINALPFRAYEMIYNQKFRNQHVDPFYKNGEPCYNEFLTNDGDGADSTTPVTFFRMPYEFDMFTRALPTPQMGPAPLVGVTTNDTTGMGYLDMVPLVNGVPDPTQAYKIAVRYNTEDNNMITGITNYEEVADKTSVVRLQEVIDFGISINDLRNVSAYQRLKERAAKAGYQFQDFEREFYGTTPPIGEELPEYLGGCTREVMIGKIQNTAKSSDYALGEFAGVGGVAGESKKIRCFCAEPCYIIGVMWFSVTPIYSQAIPKHFLKHHRLDYFNPQLNAIGPQPIMRHELAPLQLSLEHLFDVFGYQSPWYDYRERYDECHGLFRGNMRNYLLQRFFLDAPELTERFINIYSDELTDVYANVENEDKFFGLIRFNMQVKSLVARVATPRIVG